MTEVFKDAVSVRIKSSSTAASALREVPGASGIKWSFHVYPLGTNHMSSYIQAGVRVHGGSVTVNATVEYNDAYTDESSTKTCCFQVNDGTEGLFKKLHHNYSRITFRRCTVTCKATFTFKKAKLAPVFLHEVVDQSKSHCFDAKITVDGSDIKVHRGFLSMISPVFSAMFTPETKESTTGIIDITDFTASTVKNALDYCYGIDLKMKTAPEIIDMLRFYDKYDIQPVMVKLEAWLKSNLSIENFAPIAAYAWQYSSKSLQAECGRMFHKNVNTLACHPDFVALDPTIVSEVLKAGATFAQSTDPDTTLLNISNIATNTKNRH